MPWVNLDDDYAENPDNWTLTDAAFRLHTAGICYANSHLTDGHIPKTKPRTLVPRFRPAALEELLQDHWHEQGDAYVIRNYLKWNRSKAEIESERERLRSVRSEAGKKGAAARWQTR